MLSWWQVYQIMQKYPEDFPVHFAIAKLQTTDPQVQKAKIQELLKANPTSFNKLDTDGKLPLHILCSNGTMTAEALLPVLEAYPDAAKEPDMKGQLPLHLLCKNINVPPPEPNALNCYSKHAQRLLKMTT